MFTCPVAHLRQRLCFLGCCSFKKICSNPHQRDSYMPAPRILNTVLLKYRRFPQITCKLSYYCSDHFSTFRSIKRKAYRHYRRKKMYRRRFFQYLRRKWLTCARGALAVKYISPILSSNSRASSAKGRRFVNAQNIMANDSITQTALWQVNEFYCLRPATEIFEVAEESLSSSEV